MSIWENKKIDLKKKELPFVERGCMRLFWLSNQILFEGTITHVRYEKHGCTPCNNQGDF